MATPTIDASGLTTIDDAESTTRWFGDTFALNNEDKKHGTNSVECALTTNGVNDVWVDKASGSWNMDGLHLRMWWKTNIGGNLANEAGNGIQVFLYDGTNTDYFTVGGSDTYAGGWINQVTVCDSTRFPTVNRNAITRVGIRFNTTSKPRNVPANAWFDYWKFGDGIIVTGGTSGDPINIDGIAAEDAANGYGVVENIEELVNALTGSVQVGNGATATYYKDDNKTAGFKNETVAADLYRISFVGSGCEVEIIDSDYKSAGISFDFLMDDADLLSATVNGVKLTNAGSTRFKAGQTVTGSVWNQSGMVEPNAATFTDNRIKNSTAAGAGTGALKLNLTNNTDNITFSGNDRDALIDEAGTYNDISFSHSNNTFDIDYNNAANATFNTPSDGNTSTNVTNTGAGALTVVNAVSIEITAEYKNGSPAVGARIYAFRKDNKAQIISGTADANGKVVVGYSGVTPIDIGGWARDYDLAGSDYVAGSINGQVKTGIGFQQTVILEEE